MDDRRKLEQLPRAKASPKIHAATAASMDILPRIADPRRKEAKGVAPAVGPVPAPKVAPTAMDRTMPEIAAKAREAKVASWSPGTVPRAGMASGSSRTARAKASKKVGRAAKATR